MDFPDKTNPAPPAATRPVKQVPKGVVSGASPVKRPATQRFLDYMFAESPKEIAKRVLTQTVGPRLKLSAYEAFDGMLSGLLFGGAGKPMGGLLQTPAMRGGGINYAGISTGQSALQQAQLANQARPNVGNYRDLVLDTPDKAEILYANLIQLHNQYRMVTVADLWEMAGLTPEPSMNAYGWHSLEGARITKDLRGFVLQLPPPTLV